MSLVDAPPSSALERYEAVIGIEVHCQLRTLSKMFCACSTDYDGAPPNTRTCPVCLGLPGALPTINRQAVEHVLTTGLAIGATTPPATRWDRKNYFYPDLPKGYQISQYDLPLASAGKLTFDTSEGPVTIRITRAHLEEDTAKLIHATAADGTRVSLVDFNRSGAPLMEIVTEPDVRTAEQASRYAEELPAAPALDRRVGCRHGARPDAGRGQRLAPPARHRALRDPGRGQEHELVPGRGAGDRLRDRAPGGRARRGETLTQDTRGWDDGQQATYVMRSKEDSHDYRYFPEPDLPPLRVDAAWLAAIRARACPSCRPRGAPAIASSACRAYDAAVIVAEPAMTGAVRCDPAPPAPALPARRSRTSSPATTAGRPSSRRAARRTASSAGPSARRWPTSSAASSPASCLGRTRRRSSSSTSRRGTAVGRDRRRPGTAPDLRCGCARFDHRRRARGQPRRGRRPSSRQAVDRVPRRPGHEGVARPGERSARPGGPPRAPRRRRLGRGLTRWARSISSCGSAGVSCSWLGYTPGARAVGALPGPQGAGRQRGPLRGVARRHPRGHGPTGASVAMAILRRQAQVGAGLGIIGLIAIVAGFVIR